MEGMHNVLVDGISSCSDGDGAWGERRVLEVIVHYKTIDQGVDSRLAIGCVDGSFKCHTMKYFTCGLTIFNFSRGVL